MMDGTGGYLLTGIKVDNRSNVSTDNPNVNLNPPVKVNPSDANHGTQDERDVKPARPVIKPAGTSPIDSGPEFEV